MCGIAGFIKPGDLSHSNLMEIATRISKPISHRGPDDSGSWCDVDSGLGLAHRRLAILDLSPAGHQPMTSPSGKFIIVFNGEIYNHREIRKEIEESGKAPNWRGHSDTETILTGFDIWGIEATLRRAIGMFAFAVWDKSEKILILSRDRMGEKPLYYGWHRGAFVFASELKALRAYPDFHPEVNRDAITLLLRHNYIPAPYSIYRGIFKLLPGTMLTLRKGSHSVCPWDVDAPPFESFKANGVSLHPYWSLRDVAEKGQAQPFVGTEVDAFSELERVLTEAVQSQQMSDVPLGAFLSGGVDSSTIVALMQAHANRPVKTFTIGFNEDGYNEAVYAKEVARHLGTEHTELYVTSTEAMAVIPSLPALYDEPFSDSSQIPTFLVSQLAKQHVTVSLSGDAGDELFGGYNRYRLTSGLWKKINWIPIMGRQALAHAITKIPPSRWDQLYSTISSALPGTKRSSQVGDKAHKLAEILSASSAEAIYRCLVSHWKTPAEVICGGHEPMTSLTNRMSMADVKELEHRMMFLDMISYLPGDILAKVDRAAMGVSLETRVPFLDHRVVELAWKLPLSYKVRSGEGKWLLRQLLYKYVPREIIERPKMGFGVPIDSWLRGPLRDWAEELLNENRLTQEGYFEPGPIRLKWQEHLSGQRNWQYYLWDVLMFQAWLESTR